MSTSFLGQNNVVSMYMKYDNGFVGIGNTNPTAFLDVAGNIVARSNFTACNNVVFESNVTINGQLTVSNVSYAYSNVTIFSSESINSNLTIQHDLLVERYATLSNTTKIFGEAQIYKNVLTFSNFGSNFIACSNAKFGFGTEAPAYTLDVNGYVNATGYCNLLVDSYTDNSTNKAATPAAVSNVYYFGVSTSNRAYTQWTPSNNFLYLMTSNVGIGISNPDEKLAVVGNLSMSNYGKVIFTTSNNYIGINRSAPKATLDLASGNILAKNYQKLTKSADTSNALTVTLNWDTAYATKNTYFIVGDLVQMITNGTDTGFRSQRVAIGVSNQTIAWSKAAEVFGAADAYISLASSITASTTTSVTFTSSTSWVTTGDLAHSLTFNVIQFPDTANIGNVWLS